MIKDLGEIQKLLKLCRKYGVSEITLEGVSLKLGDVPAKKAGDDDSDDVQTDEPTDDQMAFFSVQPRPTP